MKRFLFDEVIVATGATNATVPVPEKTLPTVVSAWGCSCKERNRIWQGICHGGGLVGVETAEYLASRGCKVTIVEMMDRLQRRKQHCSSYIDGKIC